jgi:hypothetical protein
MVLVPAGATPSPVRGTPDAGSPVDAGPGLEPDAGSVAVDSGTVMEPDAGFDAGVDPGFDAGPCGAFATRLISATIDVSPASVTG